MEMFANTLRITNEVQTDVKVGVPNYLEEGQYKSYGSQNDLPSSRANQSNMGIVKRTKKKGNPSIVKEKKVSSK